MSRSAANIFVTGVTLTDGQQSQVISSQSLCNTSVQINRPQDFRFLLDDKKTWATEERPNSGTLFLLMTLCTRPEALKNRKLHADAWFDVFEFLIPVFNSKTPQKLLREMGAYACAIRRPASLFQKIEMDLAFVVDAAMRGQEDIVMNILRADPSYLLKKAKVKNSAGIEYDVTPLQAAIMANDIQMVEKMEKSFKDLPNGIAEMHQQIKDIYLKSLRSLQPDTQVSESDDISVIIKTHNEAQEANAFDFKPYVEAILAASEAELDVVMQLINTKTSEEAAQVAAATEVAATQTAEARAKSFDELTLVEKLNRFREELVKHMQKEIIFNPHHISAGLKINEETWDTLPHAADPEYKKRTVIFSQLAGWAQRKAAEPVKQDIRQGTWYLTEKNEPHTRPACFNDLDRNYNIVRNSLVDVSIVNASPVHGLGFKFAIVGAWAHETKRVRAGASFATAPFQNLCRAKTASLENLCSRVGEQRLNQKAVA